VWLSPESEVYQAAQDRFHDKVLSSLLMAYFVRGKPEETLVALRQQRESPAVIQVRESIEAISRAQLRALAALAKGDPTEAGVAVQEASEAEQLLLQTPTWERSPLVRELARAVSSQLFARAKAPLDRGDLEAASVWIDQGCRVDPRNVDIAGALGMLERTAARALNEQPGCETFHRAASITRAESALNRKALEQAARCNCTCPPGLPSLTAELPTSGL